MREKVLKRMEQEVEKERTYLVSGKVTVEQMVEQAYPFVVKQGIYSVFANHNFNKLCVDEWDWLNRQKGIVDYLYGLWMGNDTDLMEEFAEIIQNEINLDMEVHRNE